MSSNNKGSEGSEDQYKVSLRQRWNTDGWHKPRDPRKKHL